MQLLSPLAASAQVSARSAAHSARLVCRKGRYDASRRWRQLTSPQAIAFYRSCYRTLLFAAAVAFVLGRTTRAAIQPIVDEIVADGYATEPAAASPAPAPSPVAAPEAPAPSPRRQRHAALIQQAKELQQCHAECDAAIFTVAAIAVDRLSEMSTPELQSECKRRNLPTRVKNRRFRRDELIAQLRNASSGAA